MLNFFEIFASSNYYKPNSVQICRDTLLRLCGCCTPVHHLMSIGTRPYSRFQPMSGSCGEIVVWGRKVSGKSCRIHGHMNHSMILPFIEWIIRFDVGLTAPLRLLSCYLSVGLCFISMHGSGLYSGRLFGIHSGLRGGKTKRDRGITACVESSMEVSCKLRALDHNVEFQSFRRVIG